MSEANLNSNALLMLIADLYAAKLEAEAQVTKLASAVREPSEPKPATPPGEPRS